MKVLHICYTLDGGAGLCAKRIIDATSQCGVETKLLVCKGETQGNIYKVQRDWSLWEMHPVLSRIKNLFIKLGLGHDEATMMYDVEKRLLHDNVHVVYHVPYSCYTSLADHALISWADVIHLHWVAGMLDYPTFFRKVKKPIVWTMHDKYPMSGLLHLADIPLPESLQSIDDECRRIKRDSIAGLDNLHLVAISQKMLDACKESNVTSGLSVSLIHNGVDGAKFHQEDAIKERKKLGIDSCRKVFFFSSYWILDPNKGLNVLINALESLKLDNITLICAGHYKEKPKSSIDIRYVGFVSDNEYLSQLYSMADYFVLPSYEESFAQTPFEAMACGTPVIAFPSGAIPELINEKNGVVCSEFTIDALADGIREAMSHEYNSDEIREYVLSRFSCSRIAQQYVELYHNVM